MRRDLRPHSRREARPALPGLGRALRRRAARHAAALLGRGGREPRRAPGARRRAAQAGRELGRDRRGARNLAAGRLGALRLSPVRGAHVPAARRRAVALDLGGVLIHWDPRLLYRKLLPTEEAVERFLATVCSSEWNARLDAGESLARGIAERIERFPASRAADPRLRGALRRDDAPDARLDRAAPRAPPPWRRPLRALQLERGDLRAHAIAVPLPRELRRARDLGLDRRGEARPAHLCASARGAPARGRRRAVRGRPGPERRGGARRGNRERAVRGRLRPARRPLAPRAPVTSLAAA